MEIKTGYKLNKKEFDIKIYDKMVEYCNRNNLIIHTTEDAYIVEEPKQFSKEKLWLQIDKEQRSDKAFLFSNLKYKFIDNDINKGIDTTKPLIEINGEILTCDECLEKIVQYTYDVGQVKKKNAYIYARKKAKQYIREVIGELGEDTEE